MYFKRVNVRVYKIYLSKAIFKKLLHLLTFQPFNENYMRRQAKSNLKMVYPFLAPYQPHRVGGKYLGKTSGLLNMCVDNRIESLTEYTSFSFKF